jgi:hypothetical protein
MLRNPMRRTEQRILHLSLDRMVPLSQRMPSQAGSDSFITAGGVSDSGTIHACWVLGVTPLGQATLCDGGY